MTNGPLSSGPSIKWVFIGSLGLLILLLLFYLALTYVGAPADAKATVLVASLGIVTALVGYIAKVLSG